MNKLALLTLILFLSLGVSAQKYMTKTGFINFFSDTPIEEINANNYKVSSVLDIETGEIIFKLSIKSFEFKKKLMQEHFNENYMESELYPNSTFKGKISNPEEIDFNTNGKYPAIVSGELNIHGVSKQISAKGFLIISNEEIHANSEFIVNPADFDIKVPKLVRKKISEKLLVKIEMKYEKIE